MIDPWTVPVPINIIKRIEQVCIDARFPYWTDGRFSDAQIAEYKMRKHRGDTKMLINLSDFWRHVQEHNLKQAIKTELSDVLSNIDLQQWLENNKKRRSEAIELEV